MTSIKVYELQPKDSHKSFYKKAFVIYADGVEYLQSYNTIVAVKTDDGTIHRTWDGYSATTQRHIKAFAGLNKHEYLSLPYEPEYADDLEKVSNPNMGNQYYGYGWYY